MPQRQKTPLSYLKKQNFVKKAGVGGYGGNRHQITHVLVNGREPHHVKELKAVSVVISEAWNPLCLKVGQDTGSLGAGEKGGCAGRSWWKTNTDSVRFRGPH